MSTPSPYEVTALKAIQAWKDPSRGWWNQAISVINKPFEIAGDLAMRIPGIEWVIQKSLGGVLGILNEGASASVRTSTILEEFRPPAAALTDIHERDLEDVDRAIGFLAAKYKTLALAEGTLLGGLTVAPGAALATIPADVVALLTMSLRAIGEYATYCGFNVALQEERLFALNVLGLASSPNDAAKVVAMAQLVKIAEAVAQKKTWDALGSHAFVKIVQKIATALAIRLTKAKLAEVIPVAGAVIGGGFNAYFISEVCEAANFLYRERFLARKYGPEVIAKTVKPAAQEDFGEGYEEQ